MDKNINQPPARPPTKYIIIRSRKEHESILKDHKKCEEYGLDPIYETIVYLQTWGGWLDGSKEAT